MSEDDKLELSIMKQEIDALQIELMKRTSPWYKSPSLIISLLALLFSFGTTIVSFHRAYQEDIRQARTELRGILQRLTALPKENFELYRKYKDDPEGQSLTGSFTEESVLLTRQATDIVERFPDYLSANEYYSVAYALAKAGATEMLSIYLDRALGQGADPYTRPAILRLYGTYLLNIGRVADGRKMFEQALQMWRDYPDANEQFKRTTDAYTEMTWASAEASINNIEDAKSHVRKAFDLLKVSAIPSPPDQSMLVQLESLRKQLEQRNSQESGPQSSPHP